MDDPERFDSLPDVDPIPDLDEPSPGNPELEDPFDRTPELERRRREARRSVEEAGGGESEGFELAERELIEHSSHGDEHAPGVIMRDAAGEGEDPPLDEVFGEADEEHKPD
jgi:hypothetical protein